MLNKFINWFIRLQTTYKLRKYKFYPSDKTALLIVNCQEGFLENQGALKAQLTKLIQLAKERNWMIIHSPYSPTHLRFPTPGHQLLNEKIKSKSKNLFPLESPIEIELPNRNSLSAFAKTELENLLTTNKIEHIIVVGPMADLTIDSTIRDAVQLDFHVTVLLDCISLSSNRERINIYKLTLERYAQTVIYFNELKTIQR